MVPVCMIVAEGFMDEVNMLHRWFVSPVGLRGQVIDYANNGWIVRFAGENFAFSRYVSATDLASYIEVSNG